MISTLTILKWFQLVVEYKFLESSPPVPLENTMGQKSGIKIETKAKMYKNTLQIVTSQKQSKFGHTLILRDGQLK